MIQTVTFKAADQNDGLSPMELKLFIERVDNLYVGEVITSVSYRVRTGWRGQIRLIKAEIEFT